MWKRNEPHRNIARSMRPMWFKKSIAPLCAMTIWLRADEKGSCVKTHMALSERCLRAFRVLL